MQATNNSIVKRTATVGHIVNIEAWAWREEGGEFGPVRESEELEGVDAGVGLCKLLLLLLLLLLVVERLGLGGASARWLRHGKCEQGRGSVVCGQLLGL